MITGQPLQSLEHMPNQPALFAPQPVLSNASRLQFRLIKPQFSAAINGTKGNPLGTVRMGFINCIVRSWLTELIDIGSPRPASILGNSRKSERLREARGQLDDPVARQARSE